MVSRHWISWISKLKGFRLRRRRRGGPWCSGPRLSLNRALLWPGRTGNGANAMLASGIHCSSPWWSLAWARSRSTTWKRSSTFMILYVKEVQYLQPVILDRGLVLLTDHCLMDLAWLAKWRPRELRKCKRSSKRSRNPLSGEKQSRRKRPCHRAREEGPWWRPWRTQFQCKWLACRLASAWRRSLPQPLRKSQPPHLLLSQLSVQLNRQWFPNFCRLHFARVTFQGKETSGSQSTTTWCLAC